MVALDIRAMFLIHEAPVVELRPDDGWELTFWLGEPFDFSIPFRTLLDEIACLLGQPASCLVFPPYESDEDFVQGALRFGDQEIRVYYEYSLAYLSLSHGTRAPLDEIAAKIRAVLILR